MLEAYFVDLGWLLFALFFGVGMGSLTGLIPGFHVNNVALILLALSPVMLGWGIPLSAVAAIIVSTGTVHTFLNSPIELLHHPIVDFWLKAHCQLHSRVLVALFAYRHHPM